MESTVKLFHCFAALFKLVISKIHYVYWKRNVSVRNTNVKHSETMIFNKILVFYFIFRLFCRYSFRILSVTKKSWNWHSPAQYEANLLLLINWFHEIFAEITTENYVCKTRRLANRSNGESKFPWFSDDHSVEKWKI